MYQFRPFLNADPPALVEIWNEQPRQRGLVYPTGLVELEQLLFAKQYFEREGLIVAERDGRPVGFAHAGFGPNESGDALDYELGTTCMLMVRPDEAPSALAADLLAQSEAYMRGRGAKVLYAGCVQPLNPFYLGLYGGSELPGVLDSDEARQALYRAQGYEEIDRIVVLQCDLGRFRPPVDRRQMRLRRSMQLLATVEPRSTNWWEASKWALLQRTRFEIAPRSGGPSLASATLWDIEPLATSWGIRAGGLIELEVAEDQRRQGVATFLLSEALRQIYAQGISLVEVQVMLSNQVARALYDKLGFTEIDQGAVFRKS